MNPESTPEKSALPSPKGVYGKPQIVLISVQLTEASKFMILTEALGMAVGARIGPS
jgi:hypothetical protein